MTPEMKEQIIDEVIRFYNQKTKMHYKSSNSKNREVISLSLEKVNWNKPQLLMYIEDNYNKYYDLVDCISNFKVAIGFEWVAKTPNGKYRDGYGRELRDTLYNNEFKRFVKEIYGENSIYISIDQIRDKGVEHIKEMLKYDKSDKT